MCWKSHFPDQNRIAASTFVSFSGTYTLNVRIHIGVFATISAGIFSLIHESIGILKFRVDPSVSVVLGFPSDVVLKNISKSLQKSFVSNHSSWIVSRQKCKSFSKIPPPAFY